MFATRWEPWSEMNRLSRELDRVFSRGANGAGRGFGVESFPSLNLWEDQDSLHVEAELPGFSIDELEIYVTGNQLTIKGERQLPTNQNGSWHRQERGFGKFSRMIELPADVDGGQVTAELKLGVLSIALPKREAAKPRRIVVNSK